MKLNRQNFLDAGFVFCLLLMIMSLLTIIITVFSGFILEKPIMSREMLKFPALIGIDGMIGMAVTAYAGALSSLSDKSGRIKS